MVQLANTISNPFAQILHNQWPQLKLAPIEPRYKLLVPFLFVAHAEHEMHIPSFNAKVSIVQTQHVASLIILQNIEAITPITTISDPNRISVLTIFILAIPIRYTAVIRAVCLLDKQRIDKG